MSSSSLASEFTNAESTTSKTTSSAQASSTCFGRSDRNLAFTESKVGTGSHSTDVRPLGYRSRHHWYKLYFGSRTVPRFHGTENGTAVGSKRAVPRSTQALYGSTERQDFRTAPFSCRSRPLNYGKNCPKSIITRTQWVLHAEFQAFLNVLWS